MKSYISYKLFINLPSKLIFLDINFINNIYTNISRKTNTLI